MLILSGALREIRPDITPLIATGSAAAHWLTWPAGVDYVKLPSLDRVGADEFAARAPAVPVETVWALRRDILLATLKHLDPQAFVVDTFPADQDILPVLRHLRESGSRVRVILGLRDVVWEPELVRRVWTEQKAYAALDEVYDRILVYGDPDVHDVVAESQMPVAVAAKASYVGYVCRPHARAPAPSPARPRVVVTVGGGRDGAALLQAVIAALEGAPDALGHEWLLVTGPLMPDDARDRLAAAARGRVQIVKFVRDLGAHMAMAAAVVAMGGYNTVGEILAAGRAALIVPRVTPTAEQLVRAQALAARGLVRCLHPDQLTPERLLVELRALLTEPPGGCPPNLGGVHAFVGELGSLVDGA
jgi:predicted glycosyltransferase